MEETLLSYVCQKVVYWILGRRAFKKSPEGGIESSGPEF